MDDELEAATATIAVRRSLSGTRDRFRAYRLIDGQTIAKIKRGQAHEIKVAPGSHAVRLTIDWCSSPETRVELRGGDRVAFVCEPGGGSKPHETIPSITVEHLGPLVGVRHLDAGDHPGWDTLHMGDQEVVVFIREETAGRLLSWGCIEEVFRTLNVLEAGDTTDLHAASLTVRRH